MRALIDGGIFILMMAIVTYIGHRLSKGEQGREQFFKGGGTLPWWAVSASIIATVVSSVTFISVPAAVFKDGGNLLYFQVILGLAFGKILTAWMFAKPYYLSEGVSTTYDYIGARISPFVGRMSMWLGISATLINTAVKLLTTSLVLSVITGWGVPVCSMIIVVLSALWSWMAGLKTVIWTDFLMFLVFSFGAIFVCVYLFLDISTPIREALIILDNNAKTVLFDFSVDPTKTYTIWAGIIGAVALSIAMAGGQGTLQRVKACRSLEDANKAYKFAAIFYALHMLILILGVLLWLFYYERGIPLELAETLKGQPDRIFPYFIVNEIPFGISGILISAIFAAGISTLDSALTELSDIGVSNIYKEKEGDSPVKIMKISRGFIIFWALAFFVLSVWFSGMQAEGLLNLTFKLPNYLFGSVLGTIVLARYGIGQTTEYLLGFTASIITVYLAQRYSFSFWWWCPMSGFAMILFASGASLLRGNLRIEKTGVVRI